MKRKRRQAKPFRPGPIELDQSVLWIYFDPERTRKMGGDKTPFAKTHVSFMLPSGHSRRDLLEEIVKRLDPPAKIVEAPACLAETNAIRGITIFAWAGTQIERILANYDDKYCWWVSKEGLHITGIPPLDLGLSAFDLFVGQRMQELAIQGRWPDHVFSTIAAEVDQNKFSLKELTPAQRKPLASNNQRRSKKAVIRTFAAALANPATARSIKQRFYRAKDRYKSRI